jgi:hypothetical protein
MVPEKACIGTLRSRYLGAILNEYMGPTEVKFTPQKVV